MLRIAKVDKEEPMTLILKVIILAIIEISRYDFIDFWCVFRCATRLWNTLSFLCIDHVREVLCEQAGGEWSNVDNK
jgi:hypothetical protein